MKYRKIEQGIFHARPNRFIARVTVGGREETVHVKNTGRCKELLVPGAVVYLEDCGENTGRKTRFSLVAVEKEGKEPPLINMDSQAPNKVVLEALRSGDLVLPGLFDRKDGRREKKQFGGAEMTTEPEMAIKPEAVYGNSRLDFHITIKGREAGAESREAYIEVKGVTLREAGVARFPDAPTERGIKHLLELAAAVEEGHLAYVIFVIQMKGIKWFEPNDSTHKAFGDTLRKVKKKGVTVLAYDCRVTENSICLDEPIKVIL